VVELPGLRLCWPSSPIALLRWPLAYVLLGLGGLCCALTYRKLAP
jgi:hypothetical protein